MPLGLRLKYDFASLWEKAMSNQVVSAMSALFVRWLRYQHTSGGLPHRSVDVEWRSPCEVGDVWNQQIHWQPVQREIPGSMANVATGLDIELHPDLEAYFGHWYAGALAFSFKGLQVEPVLPWNAPDFERLQENLIGHALMQKRLRLTPTFFLAATRKESHLISLDNQSGAVCYEGVGRKERHVLASSLAAFLNRLEPLRCDLPA
jgi:SecY interacting protein Syd